MSNLATICEPAHAQDKPLDDNVGQSSCATARLIAGSQRKLKLSPRRPTASVWGKLFLVSAKRGRPKSHADVNVLLVGNPKIMGRVAEAIWKESPNRCIRSLVPDWHLRNGVPLARVAREEHIDEVVVAGASPDSLPQILEECSRNGLDVVLVPELQGFHALAIENLAGIPFIKIKHHSPRKRELALKRAIDLLLGSIAAVCALPFMLAMAIAVKLDSRGPVLYRSLRAGRKGTPFTCYKFRSMHWDAEGQKPHLRFRNEREGAFFKLSCDPRITRVGRWLRKYSLDELPQLWNVLRGEMSLVGPRPHPLDDVERYELEDLQRLDFIPGMTGLWQVQARNN